jgi:phosphoglycerate dehydrogenase-like enzyme
LCNYYDLLSGLQSGKVAGVGTDVFQTEPFPLDDPFLIHPKVFATPHVAGVTEVSYRLMARQVAENVLRIRDNLPVLGTVNNF